MKLQGHVTWTDGMRLEIACGNPPKPYGKIYLDANPDKLELGDLVEIEIRAIEASRKARGGR
jgi:hypothetical protein